MPRHQPRSTQCAAPLQQVCSDSPCTHSHPCARQVRYTFSLPYTAKLQPDGIRYPVAFYRAEAAEAVRMDTYNSTTIMIAKKVCVCVRGGAGWPS